MALVEASMAMAASPQALPAHALDSQLPLPAPTTRLLPYRPSPESSSIELLWKEYFTNPSLWWDNRQGKTNPRFPDFKNKITKDSLWIEGKHNPIWVRDMLDKMESASKGMHGIKPHELRQSSDWEVLSLEETLASLEQMPHPPPVEDFTCILLKCRREKDQACALRLHAYMSKCGMDAHTSLGNYVVPMLVEVGSMCDAQQVFDRLVDRNEYSWTSLITGYIASGQLQHAFNLYRKMQEDSVHPTSHTFVALLKACARLKDVERGQEIHAEIERNGMLKSDPYVGNALVNMYAKCGFLAKAREVFDKLPVRGAILWTVLIASYAEHGLGQEALACLEQMQTEDVSPDDVTFVCCLKACASIGAIEKGQEIHAEIARKALCEINPFIGNALVDMYAKCGLLSKAREVFDKLLIRDVVSWNALTAGYAERGLGQEVLNCFEQMELEGICPDAFTFVCSLKACGSVGAIDKGQEIHAEVARKGLLKGNVFVGSALVDMYAKCGLLAKAQEVFDKLQVRDAILWTALITGYADHGLAPEALNCFEQMQVEGVPVDAVTFLCSLKACGTIRATAKGEEIHAEIVRKGLLERDYIIGNALVDMYAKCGSFAKAQEVFDKLPVRDAVSWTTLIAGYADHGLGQEALKYFDQMQLEGISADAVTFVCSLKACGSIGALVKGQEIHAEIARERLFDRNSFIGNALVDMYAKCGSLAKARDVFDMLSVRNAVSWTTLITGYAHLGESESVFHMFERMREEGVKPDELTFLGVLSACSCTGLVDKGQTYFESMSKDYGIIPTIEHYTCMVDLFGRAGQLSEALAMIKNMPFNPTLVVWHIVLAACIKWGNVEVGRQAFEHAVQLDEKDAAAYILMSNIYADAHMQEDVREVEAMRRKGQSYEAMTELVD